MIILLLRESLAAREENFGGGKFWNLSADFVMWSNSISLRLQCVPRYRPLYDVETVC